MLPPAPRSKAKFYQLLDRGADPLRSDLTLLVAALVTLGIPPAPKDFFTLTREAGRGETRLCPLWSLGSVSACGRYAAPDMETAWTSLDWQAANPRHPLTILRSALHYDKVFKLTPRFSREQLAAVENPDTWAEAGARNLVHLLRELAASLANRTRSIVRFAFDAAAIVPVTWGQTDQTKLIKHAERFNERRAA